MKNLALLLLVLAFFNCKSNAQDTPEKTENTTYEVSKTEAEWKKILSKKEYYVLREAGTERAFSSPLNKEYRPGTYHCAGCDTPLFKSENKFDSGTGWPSFDRCIDNNVAYSTDNDLGYTRTEEHCATCGGHLGHVFNDGPSATTGKRHCINGVALNFKPRNE
ncbi:peptide-methionine (R)-S-oxide reductase MsrB [Olleya sp. YS]|uniref:peptide-methionine (R)-S-oxide reductase MsrB n=1 Tax=Olleya sp. YS TaxID=3028318 RepID=UPI0024343189|nr:peptide-methionine (R)-S-oxide reductase MsrB [Olleya sp. YS]WGD34348.1 peptide-methionine (R)-S-oxide reductase MsrB [Olleya sp. YS]